MMPDDPASCTTKRSLGERPVKGAVLVTESAPVGNPAGPQPQRLFVEFSGREVAAHAPTGGQSLRGLGPPSKASEWPGFLGQGVSIPYRGARQGNPIMCPSRVRASTDGAPGSRLPPRQPGHVPASTGEALDFPLPASSKSVTSWRPPTRCRSGARHRGRCIPAGGCAPASSSRAVRGRSPRRFPAAPGACRRRWRR